ncbi:hypothetical protein, partial [Endozoicomonas sp. ONNA2]|uniref:hypothetical protein n=1 Tax=Endozoicomonas sp. ONNA2 TaxID=2828741 RepID=UPI0021472CBB
TGTPSRGRPVGRYSRTASRADPHGATPQELYQSVCREKYEYFKTRIAEDESRLINDIAIVRSIAGSDETL